MSRPLRGMTWSHPRGLDPALALAVAASRPGSLAVTGPGIDWDHQPLSGFESRPIDELADDYDLVVIDHPGLGDAIAAGALVPLEGLMPVGDLEEMQGRFIGRSLESYMYGGCTWALPIDAACQVLAVRADTAMPAPGTWAEVLELVDHFCVALPTAHPHSLLTFLGICAAIDPGFSDEGLARIPKNVSRQALELFAAIAAAMPHRLLLKDPIELLEDMTRESQEGERTDLIPLTFGYITYASVHRPRAVVFRDAPRWTIEGLPGSVLGGTGLAVTRRGARSLAPLPYLKQAVDVWAQASVVAAAGGHASTRAAWLDPQTGRDWRDFYASTRLSQEHAWMRPRCPGWIRFQTDSSRLIYTGLSSDVPPEDIATDLSELAARLLGTQA